MHTNRAKSTCVLFVGDLWPMCAERTCHYYCAIAPADVHLPEQPGGAREADTPRLEWACAARGAVGVGKRGRDVTHERRRHGTWA